jgi:hypothetical protein
MVNGTNYKMLKREWQLHNLSVNNNSAKYLHHQHKIIQKKIIKVIYMWGTTANWDKPAVAVHLYSGEQVHCNHYMPVIFHYNESYKNLEYQPRVKTVSAIANNNNAVLNVLKTVSNHMITA